MLNNIPTFLIVLLFAILGTADPFSDCLARQLLSNEDGFVVEDATAKTMEAITQLSIEGLKEEDVTSYMNQLVEADCSSVQTSIDSAISTNDPEVLSSYLTAALMENIHAFDSIESALVNTGNRRKLFAPAIVIGAGVITIVIGTFVYVWALNQFFTHFDHYNIAHTVERAASSSLPGSHLSAPARHLSSAADTAGSHLSSAADTVSSWFGRRALSGNTGNIVSFSPSNVLMGCLNGAPLAVCSLNLAALAADFSMTLCGGTTQALECDISVESINAAIFEVNANAWSVPMN